MTEHKIINPITGELDPNGISHKSEVFEDHSEGAEAISEEEYEELLNIVHPNAALAYPDYFAHSWQPSPNQHGTGRRNVTHVAIHTVQGSYSSCINWFSQKRSRVSAHYVVSFKGHTTQMVGENKIAWHIGSENGYTVGIEHEGWVDDGYPPTKELLHASAKLTAGICLRNKIPIDRYHILGHRDFRNQSHTDPGNEWPMDFYIGLVKQYAKEVITPAQPEKPERVMFVYHKNALKSTRYSADAAAYALKQVGIKADSYSDKDNANYSADLALSGNLGENILVVQGTMAMRLFSSDRKEDFTNGGEWFHPNKSDIWDARRNVVQQTKWNISRICKRAGVSNGNALSIFDDVYADLMGKG